MSSQPCGCDPEAHWICDRHRAEMNEALDFHEEMDREERGFSIGRAKIVYVPELPDDTLYAAESRLGQTRTESAAESTANLLAGFLLALFIQFTLYPFFGIIIPARTNILAVIIFSVTSIIRSYIIRRVFNRFQ